MTAPTPGEESDGLVKRLRETAAFISSYGLITNQAQDSSRAAELLEADGGALSIQAAEITRLRAEVERKDADIVRKAEALKRFASLTVNYEDHSPSDWVGYRGAVYVSDLRLARAALEQEPSS
jgi:hypothetical protein